MPTAHLGTDTGRFRKLDVARLHGNGRVPGRMRWSRRRAPDGPWSEDEGSSGRGGAQIETADVPNQGEARFAPTEAERRVADLLPIEADPAVARAIVGSVPFWFHTFALNRTQGIYTPGAARDHRYRLPLLRADVAGLRVLDVGTFDGFYAFLAEHRGARRVVAVDNEQYRQWVAARWGIELEGGAGFRAIHRLLDSRVEYRRADALALTDLAERFDVVFCFGILHRVENPLGLLRALRSATAAGGTVLVESYGLPPEARDSRAIRVLEPGEVYAGDEFVYWGFGEAGLERLARIAGFTAAGRVRTVTVDGHPRILGRLRG